jgi:hypothetical protein
METEVKTAITFNDNILLNVKKWHWIHIDYIIDPYAVFKS